MMSQVDEKRLNSGETFVARLYIAGKGRNSLIALENLERIKARLAGRPVEIEIVDVLVDSSAALANEIYVTPTLHVLKPEPGGLVCGNLSDIEKIEHLL